MPIQLISPGWTIRRTVSRRRSAGAEGDLPGVPSAFLTDESRVVEEVLLDSSPRTRGGPAAIELKQHESMAAGRLAAARPQLDREYQDLHKRMAAARMWASVYDTACLVLPNYANRVSRAERTAALELLASLRGFAYPGAEIADAE